MCSFIFLFYLYFYSYFYSYFYFYFFFYFLFFFYLYLLRCLGQRCMGSSTFFFDVFNPSIIT